MTICHPLQREEKGPRTSHLSLECDVGTNHFTDKLKRPGHGSRSGTRLIGETSGTQGRAYARAPQAGLTDQYDV